MTARSTGDAFEQKSDALARQAVSADHQVAASAAGAAAAQREAEDEKGEELQTKALQPFDGLRAQP